MDARQFLGGKHMKKEDVPQPIQVTIKGYKPEVFMQGTESREKLVLYFEETDKGLALNTGNTTTIGEGFGGYDADKWIGKKIVIYTDPNVRMSGQRVGGLVVRLPRPHQGRPPQAAQSVPMHPRQSDPPEMPPSYDEGDPGFSDDIPF